MTAGYRKHMMQLCVSLLHWRRSEYRAWAASRDPVTLMKPRRSIESDQRGIMFSIAPALLPIVKHESAVYRINYIAWLRVLKCSPAKRFWQKNVRNKEDIPRQIRNDRNPSTSRSNTNTW